jgi:pyruvate ferredoxin oxidoreductase gamma subunit
VLDRSQTEQADFIVVLDDTLYAPDLQTQLKPGGRIIVNSKAPIPETFTFDGEAVAAEFRLPTVNTVMLGALSGVSDVVSISDLETAIDGYLAPKIREKNKQAVAQAAKEVSA